MKLNLTETELTMLIDALTDAVEQSTQTTENTASDSLLQRLIDMQGDEL